MAVQQIQAQAPDLVFLDVQMPGLNGFEVIQALDTLPPIVFSTASDQYAVQAFEVNAVDYLLKPYDRARFYQAVERALSTDPARRAASLLEEATSAQGAAGARPHGSGPPEAATGGAPLQRMLVQYRDRYVMLGVSDIRWIEAAGDYARIHTDDGVYLSNQRLGALADRLPATGSCGSTGRP